MSAFTPGQWSFEPSSGDRFGVYSDTGYRIASVHNFNDRQTANIANARLIASAPEMYQALRGLLEIEEERINTLGFAPNEEGQRRINAARAALAKADGRQA